MQDAYLARERICGFYKVLIFISRTQPALYYRLKAVRGCLVSSPPTSARYMQAMSATKRVPFSADRVGTRHASVLTPFASKPCRDVDVNDAERNMLKS